MFDKGQWREFGQDTRVTPLLFTRSAMGFLMTTESQDLGLTSHLKDVFFFDSIVSLYWGVKTHTDHRSKHPLLVSLKPLPTANLVFPGGLSSRY